MKDKRLRITTKIERNMRRVGPVRCNQAQWWLSRRRGKYGRTEPVEKSYVTVFQFLRARRTQAVECPFWEDMRE